MRSVRVCTAILANLTTLTRNIFKGNKHTWCLTKLTALTHCLQANRFLLRLMENKNPFLRKWQEIHKLKKASWNNGIRINLRLRISTGEKNLVVATPKYCFDVDIINTCSMTTKWGRKTVKSHRTSSFKLIFPRFLCRQMTSTLSSNRCSKLLITTGY